MGEHCGGKSPFTLLSPEGGEGSENGKVLLSNCGFSLFPGLCHGCEAFSGRLVRKGRMVIKSEFVSGYYVQQRPWTPTKRRGPIAADFKTPGPGAFTIPSTIGGQTSSNVTRGTKSPAYTFGSRIEEKKDQSVPGPGTYNISGLSEKGKETVNGPTIATRLKDPEPFVTPSPGAYNPEKAETSVLTASPKYTFGSKVKDPKPEDIPAPGAYCPEKADAVLAPTPAYTFGLKPKDARPNDTPAPGTYSPEKADTVLAATPAYTFGLKPKEPAPDDIPAPGRYSPEKADSILAATPAYTFGSKPKDAKPDDTPAPGKYDVPDADTYKSKSPSYTLSYRTNIPSDHTKKPGPGAHSPERVWMTAKSSPRFTFGIRHSPCAETPRC